MPIPTAYDGKLGEIDDIAGSIMISLRTMATAAPKDVPGMRAVLRERLQSYVDTVMAAAPGGK
jgi:hypothetical protein